MIIPEQIPDNVVMSARRAWLVADDGAVKDWKKAIAAAINAWPRMEVIQVYDDPEWEGEPDRTVIELPLPQEKNDG